MLLAPPVGGAECRLLLLPRARGRHEDDMLDARLHGRVDGSDVLRLALSGFRIDGGDDEQTIKTRISLRKAFGPVVVAESSLSRSRDGFGRARNSHYLVPAGTLQQFRNHGSAQMAAGATYADFHVGPPLCRSAFQSCAFAQDSKSLRATSGNSRRSAARSTV